MLVSYLENSRAHRILWLLEELELPYEVKVYKRAEDMRAPSELKSIHPLGKSPMIEADGRVFAESGAIIEYFIERYGEDKGLAPDPASSEHWDYLYWLHYSEGSAMPVVTQKLIFQMMPERVPALIRPIAKLISKGFMRSLTDPSSRDHMALWESTLKTHGWFVGDQFTAADIAMSFPVEAGYSRFERSDRYPAIEAFLTAIQGRPAYQRALERGSNYSLAWSG